MFLITIWIFPLILTMFLPSKLTQNFERIELGIDGNSESDDETNLPKAAGTIKNGSTVIFLYYHLLIAAFLYGLISFYVPLLVKYQVGLDLGHVKFTYIVGSLFSLIMFITVYLWIVNISERKVIAIGAVLSLVPISVTFYFALFWDNNFSVNTGYLLLLAVLVSEGQIVNFSLFCSLLSKLTPVENSSFYQSLSITIVHLSFIFSRLIGGATFDKMPLTYISVFLIVNWLCGIIWLSIEYKNLQAKS